MTTKGRIDDQSQITTVTVSREYMAKLGITSMVNKAVKTNTFNAVYERLLSDAADNRDIALINIMSGEHLISVQDGSLTFEAVQGAE